MMKKLLSIILIFVSFAAAGQTITYTPMNAAGYRYKYLLSDSGFNLPFGDTAIKRGDTRAGALICNSADSIVYRWDGLKWVTMGNVGILVQAGVDSITINGPSLCSWTGGVSTCYALPQSGSTMVLSGSVIWDSLFAFHNTVIKYLINGQYDTTAAGTFTITGSHPTDDRYTIVYADTLGNLGTIDGLGGNGLLSPIPTVDAQSQILLATYYVPATSSQPASISNEVIYKENVEWTVSGTARENAAYTVNPYAGLLSVKDTSLQSATYIDFVDSLATHSLGDYTYISFQLRLDTIFTPTQRWSFMFMLNNGAVTTPVVLNSGGNGYLRTIAGAYQFIAIPISSFYVTNGSTFNKLRITTFGNNPRKGFQIDNIILQNGGGNISTIGVTSFQGGDGSAPRIGAVIQKSTDDVWSARTIDTNYNASKFYIYNSQGAAVDSVTTLQKQIVGTGSVTITESGDSIYINSTGGGGSGITKLGTGQLGLVDVNDSTYRLDTASVSVLSRQRAAATYQTLINFPYTTNKYYTGYGTFGSLYDSARLALSAGSGISYNNSTGVITATGGGGTVSDFTAGTLSPLFTTSVANSTTTPALTFAQSNANQYEILGRKAVGAGAYSFLTTDSSLIPDLHSQGYYDGRYLQTNSGWSLTGNSAIDTAINFIGTTDNKALRFKMKGQWAGIIDSATTTAGQVSFGFKAGGINSSSVSIGFKAGTALIAAGATGDNVAVGTRALFSATGTAQANTAVGSQALYSAASGASYYTAIGFQALYSGGGGAYHTAVGYRAMYTGGYGSSSTAVGANSLYSQSTAAGSNVAIGYSSLYGIGNYSGNTALGSDAGRYYTGNVSLTQSSNSIFIGYLSAALGNNQTNQTVIGYNAIGNGSNTTTLGNTSVTDTYVSGSISLGTTTPAASALLNMVSTTKGLLIPRMTTAARDAIASPAQGLHIWNTTDSASYFHDGTRWNKQLQQVAATITGSGAGTGWDLSETWNTSGTPTAFKLNVTSTASNAASLLMDLQTGGTSQFKVDKIGDVTTAGLITGGNVISAARTVKAGNSTSTAFLQNGFITDATYPQFGITTGQAGTFYSEGAYTLVNGSVEWSAFSDSTTINQTGTNTAMTRSFFAHPILTSAPDYRAFETVASSGKGFYQTHATPINNFVGATNIGSVAVPSTSAQLEITSTTKGVLMPRMTATQGSAITKVDGLIIYVTNTDATFTALGFWGVENNIWIKL